MQESVARAVQSKPSPTEPTPTQPKADHHTETTFDFLEKLNLNPKVGEVLKSEKTEILTVHPTSSTDVVVEQKPKKHAHFASQINDKELKVRQLQV